MEIFTSLKYESLIRDADDYEKTLHHDLLIVSENDSIINQANEEREKLSILQFSLSANADDSIMVFFENSKELRSQIVFQFLAKEKKWIFDGYN